LSKTVQFFGSLAAGSIGKKPQPEWQPAASHTSLSGR